LAPEQVGGGRIPADARTDVWGLGVTLFEALLRQRPFDVTSRAETYRSILTRDPPDPRTLRKDLPRDVRAILLTALEKDPNRRYASAEAFADDLARAARGEPVLARPSGIFRRLGQRARRHPVVAASIAMAVLSLLVGFAATLWSLREARIAEAEASDLAKRSHERAVGLQAITGRLVEALFQFSLPMHIPEEKLRPLAREIDAALELAREAGVDDPETIVQQSNLLRQRAEWGTLLFYQDNRERIEAGLDLITEAKRTIDKGLLRFPEHAHLRRESVAIATERSHRLRALKRSDEALEEIRSVRDLLSPLAAADASINELRTLACAVEAEGEALIFERRWEESRDKLAEGLLIRERVMHCADSVVLDRSDFGLIALKVAMVDRNLMDFDGMREHLAVALPHAEAYLASNLQNGIARDRLADVWRFRAYLAGTERNLPAARVAWELSANYQISVLEASPDSSVMLDDALKALSMVDRCARAAGDLEHAARNEVRLAEVRCLASGSASDEFREAARGLPNVRESEFSSQIQAYMLLRESDRRAEGKDPRVKSETALLLDKLGWESEARSNAKEAEALFGGEIPASSPARLKALVADPPSTTGELERHP
jgi:hypothetical protein